ncbi:WlaTC/HtrL family glycosyltransferase, partial [Escherichia coli]|uniref:WlaTC/HtrL family glycosyltransferase n=1 Tax=Escherichia coli TaxID=562 RepID=UPI0025ABF337
DRNRSHWSTSKTPSYTKSVSWQHHPQHKWKEFYKLVLESQKITLNNNIVDDDQGIFVMCYYKRPDLFNLNYLGRGKWFDLFRCFRSNTLGAKMQALRIFLSRK